jgi:hypothetical protein
MLLAVIDYQVKYARTTRRYRWNLAASSTSAVLRRRQRSGSSPFRSHLIVANPRKPAKRRNARRA